MITRYASRPAMIVAPHVVLRAMLRLVCVSVAGVSLATASASRHGPPVFPFRQAAIVRAADRHSDMAGMYEGQAPAADAATRRFTLLLMADGTAALTTFYMGKNSTTERGYWTQEGDELVLSFNPLGPHQPPSPIAFRYRRHALWPIRWNQSEWGHAGPPVLHRSRRPAGSTKNSL